MAACSGLRPMRYALACAAAIAAFATPIPAATTPADTRIAVVGKGSISRMPDIAELKMEVSGEGKTPEVAVSAMTQVQARVEAALGNFGLTADAVRTSGFAVEAVRAGDCEDLARTTGECAIVGHRANQTLTTLLQKPQLAGDAVAAAARAGASDARVSGMRLADPAAVRRQASAQAISDARVRAQRTADAAGMKLGTMLTLRDSDAYDSFEEEDVEWLPNELPIASSGSPPMASIVVTGNRVTVRPEPIVTTVSVTATFSLVP